jgi:hypothetical protein
VAIDIFADTMSGEAENSAATMVPVLRRARIIAKLLDATVLLIHHASKARPEDARGSVAFKGALDVMNAVVQDAKGIALRPIKYKSDPLQKEIRFHIAENILQPGAADAGSTWVETYTRERGAIALAHTLLDIASQGFVTRTELRVALSTAYPEWFGPTVVRNTAADRLTKVIDDCLRNDWAIMKGSRYTRGSRNPHPCRRLISRSSCEHTILPNLWSTGTVQAGPTLGPFMGWPVGVLAGAPLERGRCRPRP